MVWVEQVISNKLEFLCWVFALQYLAAAIMEIWLDRCCMQSLMHHSSGFVNVINCLH